MLAALKQQHVAAAARELVGEHRAGRSRSHDDDLGRQRRPAHVARGHALHGLDPDRRRLLDAPLVLRALGERHEPRPCGCALVAVVAEERELLRGADHRRAQIARPARQQPVARLVEEPPLDPALAPVERHQVERRMRTEHRQVREREEREPDRVLVVRAEAREVAVDADADLRGRDVRVVAQHEHLGECHERAKARRRQVPQAVARADRHVVHAGEADRHQQRAREPAPPELIGAQRQRLRVVDAVIAAVQRGHEHRRHRQVRDDDQRDGHGRPASLVPEHEQREREQQQVLGHRVRGERELGVVEDPGVHVEDAEPDRRDRERQRRPPEHLLRACERGALRGLAHDSNPSRQRARNAAWSSTTRSKPAPWYISKWL